MDDKVTFNTKNNMLTAYYYEMDDNISYFMMSINDGPWVKYRKPCPEDTVIRFPENSNVKIRVKKFNRTVTSVLSFSVFDTNRAVDFEIDDPTEFRPDDGQDDRPIEIKED